MMTPRERWVAAMRLQPVDRLPFWPKLDAAYAPAQQPPFREMALPDIHDWIGSDRHEFVPPCHREVRTNTSFEVRVEDGVRRSYYHTPLGTLTATHRWDPGSRSWHPTEFPVKSREGLPVLTAWHADSRVEVNPEGIERSKARAAVIGQSAVIAGGMGETPLMQFVEWLAGVEMAHVLLAEAKDEVEELFGVMQRRLARIAEVAAAHSPADILYSTENTSTTLISPAQFRAYSLPHLQEYARILNAAGRLLVLHMCGHLKVLLPDLATVGAAGFEAFTSPTLGNTTLLDGRIGCPEVCLVGGTNAMLWLKKPAEIIAQIERDLEPLPHHRGLVITSAGVMPPGCPPETIHSVCRWVHEYAARM